MNRTAAEKALVKLARQSAATWARVRGEAFVGETTLETDNTVYAFHDGVFVARAPRRPDERPPAWDAPPSMQGLELIGFLADEGGLWSLSSRWRPGALAVLWRLGSDLDQPFTLTSPTRRCDVRRPAQAAPAAQPPTRGLMPRRPPPASMTRLQQHASAR